MQQTSMDSILPLMKRFRQMLAPLPTFVHCTNVSVAAQNTLSHSTELISQII